MTNVAGILFNRRVLVVHTGTDDVTAPGRCTAALLRDLHDRDVDVVDAVSVIEAAAQIATHALLQAVMVDWELPGGPNHEGARQVIAAIRAHTSNLPVFLLASRGSLATVPSDILEAVNDYVWLFEDTPDFIGGRVVAAIDRYRANLLSPMFNALAKFAGTYEYSWHTPGHAGGMNRTGFFGGRLC